MTAYWERQFPVVPDMGAARRAGVRRAVVPTGSLVVGRFHGTVTVTLHGDLEQAASEGLSGVLGDLIDGQGNLAVAVDLRDVGRIDGAGIAALASAGEKIAARGGELRLGGPTGAVFDSLALAGLAGLVSIPSERRQRAPAPGRGASASLRRSTSHPAGGTRHRRDERGDTS